MAKLRAAWILAACVLLSLPALPPAAQAETRYPTRPGDREFVKDEAGVVRAEDAAEIRKVCDLLLTDLEAPLIVVTIKSKSDYGAADWPIERYALNLFAEWQIGIADWNHGVLLLVAVGDRRARIELGSDWSARAEIAAARVMDGVIVPRFKAGDISAGILAGVRALDRELRAEKAGGGADNRSAAGASPAHSRNEPSEVAGYTRPASGSRSSCGGIGLVALIAIVVSLFGLGRRGGSSPFGGLLWGGLGGFLGSMLYNAHRNRSGSAGGGFFGGSGFGGGSYGGPSIGNVAGRGGGFSGGRGATGSW
ncbi:MAG: TPM domain-containing protein [Planctomycetes bacterium]|nr:TPM domain-containing protein [Planctomycetota bacterium]